MSVQDVLEPPKTLPPVLPGYRPPFNSITGKAASIKGLLALEAKRQARRALNPSLAIKAPPSEVNGMAARIGNLKRAHSRCIAASVASTSGKEAAAWMRAAKDALEQLQSLLGHNPKSHKSTKKPHLAGLSPSAKIEPLPSGNQGVNPTVACPAPETAPIAPVSPIPPKPAEIGDCPF